MPEFQENEPTARQYRPKHAFTAVLRDRTAALAVIDDLTQLGMNVDEVRVLHGKDGIAAFDYTGESHGVWAHVRRSIKNAGGADGNILAAYEESLQHGKSLILVPRLHFEFDDLVEILRRHSAHAIGYFTPETMESVPSQPAATPTGILGHEED